MESIIRTAGHDVLVQLLPTQVEEAILQADVFRIFLIAKHRQRQFGGRAQHLDLIGEDFDLAGRQVRILGARGAIAHLAVDLDHPFRTQFLGVLEGRAVGIGHHLGEAIMVAQVDEQHAAMVADAMHPAGDPDRGANVGLAERAAGVGAITVHENQVSQSIRYGNQGDGRRGKAHGGARFVKASCGLDSAAPICILRARKGTLEES